MKFIEGSGVEFVPAQFVRDAGGRLYLVGRHLQYPVESPESTGADTSATERYILEALKAKSEQRRGLAE